MIRVNLEKLSLVQELRLRRIRGEIHVVELRDRIALKDDRLHSLVNRRRLIAIQSGRYVLHRRAEILLEVRRHRKIVPIYREIIEMDTKRDYQRRVRMREALPSHRRLHIRRQPLSLTNEPLKGVL